MIKLYFVGVILVLSLHIIFRELVKNFGKKLTNLESRLFEKEVKNYVFENKRKLRKKPLKIYIFFL